MDELQAPTVIRKPAAGAESVKPAPTPTGKAPVEAEHELSWCHELMLPVRRRAADSCSSRREPGLAIEATILGRDSCDEVIGQWPDGMVEAMPAFTYQHLALLTRKATRPKSATAYVEAAHHTSNGEPKTAHGDQ